MSRNPFRLFGSAWSQTSLTLAGLCLSAVASAAGPIKVACIGDSITEGAGTVAGMAYPRQLQDLLGDGYAVRNFGVSGRTLLRKGDYPYWNEAAYQNALRYQPDVVVIMLGTNDSKPWNWNAHGGEFDKDYRDLVASFQNLPTKPKIYLCRPCPVPDPGNYGINEKNVDLEIPLIDQIAKDDGAQIVDMHAALLPNPAWLPDRVHPNTEGAGVMAATVYTALTGNEAPPRPNSLFNDGAVLQRGMPVPVWGTGREGETITVEFNGQSVNGIVKGGVWSATLKSMAANDVPQNMVIRGKTARTIRNILVGDVWVAGGQSNMERQLGPREGQKELVNWRTEAASANYPEIRQYYVPQVRLGQEQRDANGRWTICTPQTAPDFTAVGYYFARDLNRTLHVPIGILHSSVGGTPAEDWTSAPTMKKFLATLPADAVNAKSYPRLLDDWVAANDPGEKGGWAKADFAGSDWKSTDVPSTFDQIGLGTFDGTVWYRRDFDISDMAAGKEAILTLGSFDDADTTWVNGTKVGGMYVYGEQRVYKIPAGLLKAGRNSIAIRVLDTGGGGGWASNPADVRLDVAGQRVSLAGPWSYQVGVSLANASPLPPRPVDRNSYSTLYDAMIAPLQKFPIKGAIWYQGEANNDRATEYQTLFPMTIADWRQRWNQGDFPFLFVQLAPYQDTKPELREAQFMTLSKSPNTAMAVITDNGDASDIHPNRKEPVGDRLALAAIALAYGQKIEYSGPLYKSVKASGSHLVVSFTHNRGLVAQGGDIRGFEVAGTDGKFVPAKAGIKGGNVEVWSDAVANPSQVRFGWAPVPDVNFYNAAGLPASPFRATVPPTSR